MTETPLERVRRAARTRLLFLSHAVRQMSRPDRMISPAEVEAVVRNGDLVEDYPEDPRGPSCLLVGRGEDAQLLHVVGAPKDEYLAVITAYLPDPEQWSPDGRRRL